jgi:2-hydroxy-6-oxonona-2,4-dienedioate hydrolase
LWWTLIKQRIDEHAHEGFSVTRFLPHHPLFRAATGAIVLGIALLSLGIGWTFHNDLAVARQRVVHDSVVIQTRCGPIEVQKAGMGTPLLVVHGSGGGHDQGMAFARDLIAHDIQVIAVSRFGYLRTPRPNDASPATQADAHVCVLDALGIGRASVLGASAGAPSAMQMAIRHPDRVSALILVVPISYQPGSLSMSAAASSPLLERILMQALEYDFLFWAARHLARDQVIRYVMATPPEHLATASQRERSRVNAMLDNILPVSARVRGLQDDSVLGKGLLPYPLDAIRAPTLIISARDDGFGTFAGAQYAAQHIAGARLLGFEQGGHLLIGHDDEMKSEIVKWLIPFSSVSR